MGQLVPTAVVFIASACIMTVELVAGRIIARSLGQSLYTWTSVIGIVLAGIAVGNHFGGRLADRYRPRGVLAVLLILASVACVAIPPLNRLVGSWEALWYQEWPVRIALHVLFTFIAPTAVLGTLSPVCAKMALDQGRATGRTIGNIYAWGAIGSIGGTFLTGFYLIPRLGAVEVIWAVGAVLALMGVGFAVRSWIGYAWAAVFAGLVYAAFGSNPTAQAMGIRLMVRERPDARIVFEGESEYTHLIVKDTGDMRSMILDQLLHSAMIKTRPHDLFYPYEHVYATVARNNLPAGRPLRALMIGGGGYTYPMYMERAYPGAQLEAVEIDPLVTEAAYRMFGLPRDTKIRIHHMDARNFVESFVRRQAEGKSPERYDFIFTDAVNSFSVPFHLTTLEYHEQLRKLLNPGGAYLMTMIDTYASAQFLGAMYNTVSRAFPNTHVFCGSFMGPSTSPKTRDTFILVGSVEPIKLEPLAPPGERPPFALLTEENLRHVRERSGGIVLTDNFAPVEQLLADVVRNAADPTLELIERGLRERDGGDLVAAAGYLTKAVGYNIQSAVAHGELGQTLRQFKESDRRDLALRHLEAATKLDPNSADWWSAYGTLLLEFERYGEAAPALQRAAELRREDPDMWLNLGYALLQTGRLKESIAASHEAVSLKPSGFGAWYNLAMALARSGRLDEAVPMMKKLAESNPKRHDLANELAWILAVAPPPHRDGAAAVRCAELANDATGRQNALYLDTLAAAYAAAGRFDQAVATARRSIELYPSQGKDPTVVQGMKDRLRLYEQGQPYTLGTAAGR